MPKTPVALKQKIERQLNILYPKTIQDFLNKPEKLTELSITLWEDVEVESYLWQCTNLKTLEISCVVEEDIHDRMPMPSWQVEAKLEEIFKHFTKLESLTLDSTAIYTELQEEIQLPKNINNLIYLKELNITGSLLLLPAYLTGLKNLQSLAIEGYIPLADDLGDFPRLESLSLTNVINFPQWIYRCANLTELFLDGEYEISDQLYDLKSLESLKINIINSKISALAKLQSLFLVGRPIALPIEILEIPKLNTLTFHGTLKAKSFEILAKMPALKNLVFFGGSEFNFNLPGFSKLKKLSVYDDRKHKDELPESIFSLTGLEQLTFSDGLISSVSAEISKLQNLVALSLGFNKLTGLPIEAIAGLPKLNEFFGEFQKISKVEEKKFNNQLRKLYKLRPDLEYDENEELILVEEIS